MTTVREAVRALVTEARTSATAADIKRVVSSLDRSDPPLVSGNFGYHARHARAQFFGYLLVDENGRDLQPFQVDPLADADRRILRRGHAAIAYIVRACLDSIDGVPTDVTSSLDPYRRLKPLRAPVDPAPTMFSDEAVAVIAQSVSQSPAGAVAKGTPAALRDRFPVAELMQIVARLDDDIIEAGPVDVPDDLFQQIIRMKNGSPEHVATRYWFALTCIAGMLRNLAQVIFQAIVRDDDGVVGITDAELFHVTGPVTHSVGQGLIVQCVSSTGDLLGVTPGNIVSVQSDKSHWSGEAVVYSTELNASEEYGMRLALSLQVIDDDMNPYARLLA